MTKPPDSAVMLGLLLTSLLVTIVAGIAMSRAGECERWWYPASILLCILAACATLIGVAFTIAYALTWAGVCA